MRNPAYPFAALLMLWIVCVAQMAHGWDLLPRYRFQSAKTPEKAGVNAILEDQQGMIWIGTQAGMYRLVGGKLIRQADRPKLLINHMLESRARGLWIAHAKGLSLWERATDRWRDMPCHVGDQGMWQLTLNDTHFFGVSKSGVIEIDRDSGDCKTIAISGLPEKTAIERIVLFDNALILALRERGLFRCALPCQSAQPWALDLNNTRPRMFAIRGKHLYVGTHRHGMYQLDANGNVLRRWQRGEPNQKALPANGVMSLAFTPEGQMWVGLWAGGLVEISADGAVRASSRVIPFDPLAIAGDDVRALMVARDGTIYAGHENGVSAIVPTQNQLPWISTRTERLTGLSRPEVQSVLAENESIIWVGSPKGGLQRIDLAQNAVQAYEHDAKNPASFPSHAVWDIRQEPSGNIIVGTSAGVVRVDTKTQKFNWITRGQALPSADVFRLAIAPNGDIWIAMWAGGVARITHDGQLKEAWRARDGLQVDIANSIEVLGDGTVLVQNAEGVFRHDASTNKFAPIKYISAGGGSGTPPVVQKIGLDQSGQLWAIARDGSVYVWRADAASLQRLIVPLISQADSISRMIPASPETSAGSAAIWILNTNSMMALNRNGQIIGRYPHAETMPNSIVEALHIMPGTPHKMVIGTNQGVFIRDLTRAALPITTRTPMVDAIRVFNLPYQRNGDASFLSAPTLFGDKLTLSYTQDLVSIDFDLPGFIVGDAPRFRYRLWPFDRDWIKSLPDESRATYTRLPPGKYQFQVIAQYANDLDQPSAPFHLQILPPWWLTWWANFCLDLR